jgi:toxin YoeB
LNDLIKECQRTPFTGTGKPEPLRGDLKVGGHGV